MVDYNTNLEEYHALSEDSFKTKRVTARTVSISEAKYPKPKAGDL